MKKTLEQYRPPPRVEYLKVRNFRALRDIEIKNLTPMTVLLGPNGGGKSTVLDVFAFLAECFESSLRRAWERRGRARELKTRGSASPVTIEIKYRERPRRPLSTYHLSIDEVDGAPFVAHEWLGWHRGRYGKPFRFLEYRNGDGQAIPGKDPDINEQAVRLPLKSSDLLAVNALGQFQDYPRVAALRDFIGGWQVPYLPSGSARSLPEAGPHERLAGTGGDLANGIQFLSARHPQRLERILEILRLRVPRIERVSTDTMPDGRVRLQIKDAPFDHPVPARFASAGTLKILAHLVLLHDPEPPPFIGVAEPENFLDPQLLSEVAEECRSASERTQLLVTTHSPNFLDALKSKEARLLWRDEHGYTQVQPVDDLPGIPQFMEEGALLGDLWMQGCFGMADPCARQAPAARQVQEESGGKPDERRDERQRWLGQAVC